MYIWASIRLFCTLRLIKDFSNMEFAFKYGIWEFLILDLNHETQLLVLIGYGTDLNRPVTYHILQKNSVICVL